MNKNFIESFLQQLSKILHFENSSPNISKQGIIFSILNKAQEIGIIYEVNQTFNPEMIFLDSLIKYSLSIDLQSHDYLTIVIILLFILHILIITLLLTLSFKYRKERLLILHYFLLYHPCILYLPTSYSALLFISNSCKQNNLCNPTNQAGYIIISVINLTMCFLIKSLHIYFGRSDTLLGDTNILHLEYSFLRNLFNEIILFISIVLKTLRIIQPVRFALIVIKQVITVHNQINKDNCRLFALIEISGVVSAFAIIFKLAVCEYLLGLVFILSFFVQFMENISNNYITKREQTNYITLQKIEYACQTKTQESQILLCTMFRIHNCSKCNHYQQMTQCILEQIIQKNDKEKPTLMLCHFTSNKKPLLSLIRILTLNAQTIYYQCSAANLLYLLSQKNKQKQEFIEQKHQRSQQSEGISQKLELGIVFSVWNCASELFPAIIDAMAAKIQFWSQLIKGFPDISSSMQLAVTTSNQMIKCRDRIEQKFNLLTYKLKNSENQEIMSLRILQIYYTGVYTNYYHSYILEKQIVEGMKLLITRQDEPFNSLKLIQGKNKYNVEKIFIFQTSLNNKTGNFINLNHKRLSEFLDINEEEARLIQNQSHLQPSFITSIHDHLIDNYIEQGYTKLPLQNNATFFKNLQGYLEPCYISLFNFYDNKQDFLLNLILSKESKGSDVIAFGIDGQILGFTKKFYEESIKYNLSVHKSFSNSKSENGSHYIDVRDFLKRKPLIQFYIPNIEQQVENLQYQIRNQENNQIMSLRSIWVIPNNHSDCLQASQSLLKQNKKESNFYKQTTKTKLSDNNCQEEVNNFDIDGIHIRMINTDFQEQIIQLVDYGDVQRSQFQLEIQYNLSFKVLAGKTKKIGFFILHIDDFIFQQRQQGTTVISQSQSYRIMNRNVQKEGDDQLSPNQSVDNKSEQIINQQRPEAFQIINSIMNQKESQFLSIGSQSFEQLNKLDSHRDSKVELNIDTKIQQVPFIANSKFKRMTQKTDNEKVNPFESQELQQDQIQGEETSFRQAKKPQSENNSDKKKPNLLENIRHRQKIKASQYNNDFRSNHSRSSVASTKKEAFKIVQQIQEKENLLTPLKKILVILLLVSSVILIYSIINVVLITQQMNDDTVAVMNLIKPQNIIYYYSSVLYEMWAVELEMKNVIQLSEYLRTYNLIELDYMVSEGKTYMPQYTLDVPQAANQQGFNTFNMSLYHDSKLNFINQELQSFYLIFQQNTYKAYIENLNSESPNYDGLLTTGFFRQNIIEFMDLSNQIVNEIVISTIEKEAQSEQVFLVLILLELFSILLLLFGQTAYWFFIDNTAKQIIMLISRLNENQAYEQIHKLNAIKQTLNDKHNKTWQNLNYNDILNNVVKESENDTSNNQVRSSLYSRIKKTKYYEKKNYILTSVIITILSGFLIAGNQFSLRQHESFSPSLIATLHFGQFRLNVDSLGFIAGVAKTENLIEGNNISLINQTYAISLLLTYKDSLLPLMNEVSNSILENAIANNAVSRFDNLLHNNLCDLAAEGTMLSCDPSQLSLPYDNKDSINDLVKNGVMGYTASLVKYLETDFYFEFQNLQYDNPQANSKAIQSKYFQNYFLNYYCDIQDTLLSFLNLFKEDNQDLATSIINQMSSYYLGFGISIFVTLNIIIVIWIYHTQRRMTSLRQILILIPTDLITNPNIKNQAKQILLRLY